jgi:hypothetical protein
MFMITQSGAEGISLANVRQVHIMEPFWNYVRLEQVQGRAIRICSHKDLPLAERKVEVFTYLMRFSEQQKKDRKVDETIMTRDKGLTTDQIIYTLMMTKRKLGEQMFDIMKSSAIDCTLNALEHGSKSCFLIRSGGPLFLYNPDYKEDLKESQSQYRVRDEEAPAPALEEAPPAPALEEAAPAPALEEAPAPPPAEEAPAPPPAEEAPPAPTEGDQGLGDYYQLANLQKSGLGGQPIPSPAPAASKPKSPVRTGDVESSYYQLANLQKSGLGPNPAVPALVRNAGRLNAGAGPQANRNSPNLAVENDK